ncbi:hypothetical protein [Salinimicrobium soli]|uniref:hypothetical protein n=1 Tax=Salinimicrobium soli TaxID=1254399 RepID=UPI003AACE400
MERPITTSGFYAILIGILLLIQGIWNLIDPPFLGIFTSNVLHAVIHILLGLAGIWRGIVGNAFGYSLFLGVILLAVGVLFYIEVIGDIIEELLNVNEPVALLNIGIGLLSLFMALAVGRNRRYEV